MSLLRTLLLAGLLAVLLVWLVPTDGPERFTLSAAELARTVDDAGPSGRSVGDRETFAGPLLSDGRRAGRLDGECVLTSVPADAEEVRRQCTATATLGDGELYLQAVGRLRGDDVRFGITGGNAEFRAARGEATWDYRRATLDFAVES